VETLTTSVSSLRDDHASLLQRVNQLSGALIPPLLPGSQLPLLPVVPSGDTGLYARRIGFANFSQVDAAYQSNAPQFCGRLKAILYEALVPYQWTEKEIVKKIKQFFFTQGISVDCLQPPGYQTSSFPSLAQSDFVIRSNMVMGHLRSHNWANEQFILYWTMLEICRQYRIYQ